LYITEDLAAFIVDFYDKEMCVYQKSIVVFSLSFFGINITD